MNPFINVVWAAQNSTPETDKVSMSVLAMIADAGPMVQFVILILVLSSVICWAIIFAKWTMFKRNYRKTEDFLDIFWSGRSMDFIYTEAKKNTGSALAKIFQTGYVELQRLLDKDKQKKAASPSAEASMGNLERALEKAARSEGQRLEKSLPFLATTGSTAPFVGLFGTVWGIMNAFQSIGAQGGASLDVVAPGIAEALVVTAIGLAAAIPAVAAYNYYANQIRNFKIEMDNFSADFLNIVKRNFLPG